jgi:hypothetical protein
MTATVTCTVNYVITGDLACIYVTTANATYGTSNANTFTMTGLPGALQTVNSISGPCAQIVDAGQSQEGAVSIAAAGGTVTFSIATTTTLSGRVEYASSGSNAFTTSGTKGLGPGFMFFYPLA